MFWVKNITNVPKCNKLVGRDENLPIENLCVSYVCFVKQAPDY